MRVPESDQRDCGGDSVVERLRAGRGRQMLAVVLVEPEPQREGLLDQTRWRRSQGFNRRGWTFIGTTNVRIECLVNVLDVVVVECGMLSPIWWTDKRLLRFGAWKSTGAMSSGWLTQQAGKSGLTGWLLDLGLQLSLAYGSLKRGVWWHRRSILTVDWVPWVALMVWHKRSNNLSIQRSTSRWYFTDWCLVKIET